MADQPYAYERDGGAGTPASALPEWDAPRRIHRRIGSHWLGSVNETYGYGLSVHSGQVSEPSVDPSGVTLIRQEGDDRMWLYSAQGRRERQYPNLVLEHRMPQYEAGEGRASFESRRREYHSNQYRSLFFIQHLENIFGIRNWRHLTSADLTQMRASARRIFGVRRSNPNE